MVIEMFRGEFGFLSNFYECEIKYGSLRFKNLEACFQALKSKDWNVRKMFEKLDGKSAKALGRKIKLREDWDDIKEKVMEYLVREKFKQPWLKWKLLNTAGAVLVEGNYWNDRFWGVDLRSGIGENKLGKILMKVRDELAEETANEMLEFLPYGEERG